VGDSLSVVFLLGVLLFLNWRLTLLTLVFAPLNRRDPAGIQRRLRRLTSKTR